MSVILCVAAIAGCAAAVCELGGVRDGWRTERGDECESDGAAADADNIVLLWAGERGKRATAGAQQGPARETEREHQRGGRG